MQPSSLFLGVVILGIALTAVGFQSPWSTWFPDDRVCAQDVMACPDGSSVGRDPANDCAFSPCPPPGSECTVDQDCPPITCITYPCPQHRCIDNQCVLFHEDAVQAICVTKAFGEVRNCGSYYAFVSSQEGQDIPVDIYNTTGTLIISCGGLLPFDSEAEYQAHLAECAQYPHAACPVVSFCP